MPEGIHCPRWIPKLCFGWLAQVEIRTLIKKISKFTPLPQSSKKASINVQNTSICHLYSSNPNGFHSHMALLQFCHQRGLLERVWESSLYYSFEYHLGHDIMVCVVSICSCDNPNDRYIFCLCLSYYSQCRYIELAGSVPLDDRRKLM